MDFGPRRSLAIEAYSVESKEKEEDSRMNKKATPGEEILNAQLLGFAIAFGLIGFLALLMLVSDWIARL